MNHSTPPPDREPQLTAYLLDELTPQERIDLEAELKGSPDLRSLLNRLRKTIDLVESATPFFDSQIDELPESLQFSANRRAGLLATLSGHERPQLSPKTAHSIPWYLPIGMAAGLMLALSYFAMIGRPTSGAVRTAEATSTRLFGLDSSKNPSTGRPQLLAAQSESLREKDARTLSFFNSLSSTDKSAETESLALGSQLGLVPESAIAREEADSFFAMTAPKGPPQANNQAPSRWGMATDFGRQESETKSESRYAIEAELEPAISERSRSNANAPRGITRQVAQPMGGRGGLPRKVEGEDSLDLKYFDEDLASRTQRSDTNVKLNVPTSDSRRGSEINFSSPSVRGRQRNANQSGVPATQADRFLSRGPSATQRGFAVSPQLQQPAVEHGIAPGSAGGLGGGGGGAGSAFGEYGVPSRPNSGGTRLNRRLDQDVDGFGVSPLVDSDSSALKIDRLDSGLGTLDFGDLEPREIGQQQRQSQVDTRWEEDQPQDSKIVTRETIFSGVAAIQESAREEIRLGELKQLADQQAPEGLDGIVSFSTTEPTRDYDTSPPSSGSTRSTDLIEDFELNEDASTAYGYSPGSIELQVAAGVESMPKIAEQPESDFAILPQLQAQNGNGVEISLSSIAPEPDLLGRLALKRKQAPLSELQPKTSFSSELEQLPDHSSLAKLPAQKTESLQRRISGKLAVAKSQLKAEKPDRELQEKIVSNKKRPVAFPLEQQTELQSISTFSLNVSDVSFQLAAASLEQGVLPASETIRPEEFFNALTYRDSINVSEAPVIVHTDRARHPYGFQQEILRIGVRTKSSGRLATTPLNLVVLLDNSGSMERPDRQSIVRRSLESLLSSLNDSDKISMLTFARQPRLWADGLSASDALRSLDDLTRMIPEGGTNLETAIEAAYATARKHFNSMGQNRVILLTDGAANLGNTDAETLRHFVTNQREQGIALDCFGIGWEGYDDHRLESLTRNGDGRYSFLNDLGQVESNFIQQLTGALNVAAKNVKVQIAFNPQRVTSYRQIGYAKHQLKKEQFRDNRVDAAELAAEESGTALYVLSLNANGNGPIGELAIRFQDPETKEYHELNWNLPFTGSAKNLEQTSPDTQLALIAALFAERLAGIPYSQSVSLQDLERFITKIETKRPLDPAVSKLKNMISQAQRLSGF